MQVYLSLCCSVTRLLGCEARALTFVLPSQAGVVWCDLAPSLTL